MFCNHTYHLKEHTEYTKFVVFKFQCNKCGDPKTEIREFGSDFEVEV